jgi:Zn finger protein HypA/HybF involved in hydrogenase expression
MDFGSITAAVGSLKAAGEIAKGLIGLKSGAEVQAKAIELNQKIIDAQHQIFAANAAQTSLLQQIRELEAEIARMNDWDTQKQRYKLAAPFPGCMVYALQKSMSDGEPAHYLCAACFKKGQPSILQGKEPGAMRNAFYRCPECESEAASEYRNVTAPQYFEDIKQAG